MIKRYYPEDQPDYLAEQRRALEQRRSELRKQVIEAVARGRARAELKAEQKEKQARSRPITSQSMPSRKPPIAFTHVKPQSIRLRKSLSASFALSSKNFKYVASICK